MSKDEIRELIREILIKELEIYISGDRTIIDGNSLLDYITINLYVNGEYIDGDST